SKKIDIIYFHSLPHHNYYLFDYIDTSKIVIWWEWGYDVYLAPRGIVPLLKLELYKEKTQEIIKRYKQGSSNLIDKIRKLLYRDDLTIIQKINLLCFKLMQKKIIFESRKSQKDVISRVDYFTPVLPIEYDMMKDAVSFFRAKPFMLDCGPGLVPTEVFNSKLEPSNVLIGNSLTYENNHLDIFAILSCFVLSNNCKFIIPVSYGDAYGGVPENLEKISGMPPDKTLWLKTFIPQEAYRKIFEGVSHAVFGHIRQQAMGNIFLCLRNGIKVYLYKDSIAYKQLKRWGYYVYTIDSELNQSSLDNCLTYEQAYHNYVLAVRRKENIRERTEKELSEIFVKSAKK
ncbi:MAG TPA: hypothetical protein IAD13_00380, partial [Bacteroidetes bacterium]|nr:hypothetical protein [Candidatus Limimorpha avicola]